jgi:conjugal transfer/entry exclusion protein
MYQRLIGQQQRVNTVLLASQAAPGSRSLQQANNQLLGTLNEQLAAMQMMQAAHGEMQKTWIMRQVVAEERAMANAQEHLMIDQAALPKLGIGTGKGFTLP